MFNYDYKTIQSLKYVKYRKVYNKYIVEGKRIVESALIKKVNSGPIFCTDNFYRDNKNWIQTKIDKKVLVKKINEKHFKKMTDTKSPQGILTVCDIPKKRRPNFALDKWVYLDKISDPGNMGTLIRSCEWFGITDVALSPECTDPYSAKSIRAAMGAHFSVSIYRDVDLIAFRKSHKIIAADLDGESASSYVFPKRFVLVLGNEAHGISNQNMDCIEERIFIDKAGYGDSLNVSIAGSIIMYLIMKY